MAADGIKVLNRIQLGTESTPGTAVVASTIWRGPAAKIQDNQTKVRPEENIGVSSITTRQYTPQKLANIEFPSGELHYETFDHILDAGVVYNAGTQDGVGTDYIRTHILSSSATAPAVTTLKTKTIEAGDNLQAEVMEYAVVEEFELSGGVGAAWMLSACKWFGRQSALQAFTAALSAPALSNPYLFQKSKLYIDAVGGTIGTTLISNTFESAKINIVTGWIPKYSGDGNLYFGEAQFIGAKMTAELTFYHNATTEAQKVLFRADTPRQFRIKTEGDAVATPGTTYSVKTGLWDFAGVISQFDDAAGDKDGINIAKITIECGYDPTAALFAKFVNVNELSALP